MTRNKVTLSLDGVLIHLRYPFVLLGEERYCKDKCFAQDHNKMTLTKALTQTVDPEFNGLSIKVTYLAVF